MFRCNVDIFGWLGLFFIQLGTIPAIYAALQNSASIPALMPACLVLGMGLLLYNALVTNNTLYIAANSVGLALNLLLLVVAV